MISLLFSYIFHFLFWGIKLLLNVIFKSSQQSLMEDCVAVVLIFYFSD